MFKKVTGLSVGDFNMLCSIGVFNAPLMNDAIFKFKRYEDASLTYTGIDKHANDEVGGWDTTIRKSQYEKLFYNQQYSMNEVENSAYSRSGEAVAVEDKRNKTKTDVNTQVVKPAAVTQTTSSRPFDKNAELMAKLERVTVGSIVFHKKFGKGTVVKLNSNDRYIYIKFALGEKKFVFPDAFLMGFLIIR